MKLIKLLVILLIPLVIGTVIAEDQPEKRVMNFIAVMDMDCDKPITKKQCGALTNVVIDELVKTKKYTVIDRANRDKILGEAGFQMTGCVDESCTIEAGRILGVGKIVIGALTKMGEAYLVNLQLINVETAAVENSSRMTCENCKLINLIDTIANTSRKLMGEAPVPTSSPTTIPRKIGGKCPEDMVYIPEGNFCIDIYEYPNKKGAFPRVSVNLFEARELCSKLGKRLPSRSEWKKACMGPNKYKYPYGNKLSSKICNDKKAGKSLARSGLFPKCKSDYGVYDISGNAWELVEDYSKALGGSFTQHSRNSCYSATIHTIAKGWTNHEVGFRCAKNAK